MADMENVVEETFEEEVETTENVVDTTENEEYEDNTEYSKEELEAFNWLKINPEEATIKDLAKLALRVKKTESKVIANKTQKKETKDTPITSRDEVKRLLAEEKFYDKNPEAEDYRKEIEKYQAKGLSLDDAYLLASKKDKEVEQRREIYWKWLVKWSQNVEWMSAVSIDDFDRMTPQAQDEYTKKMTAKYWKVKFK